MNNNLIQKFCRDNNIKQLLMSSESTLDFKTIAIVEFFPLKTPGMFKIIDLEEKLSELLNKPLKLLTIEELDKYQKSEILKNSQIIYIN